MFTKSALSAFYTLAACAFFVNAAAAGENVEKRQLDSSLVNSLNSVAASLATQSFSGESTTVTTTFGTQVETFTEIIGHPVSTTGKPTSAASGSSGSGGSS
ncbi:hypothetical protein C2E23DRAFT_851108 [Lenzites betulinus]|nr:hypothetical protein C2E23DRAFT_851108 [Lenzites betulinus]